MNLTLPKPAPESLKASVREIMTEKGRLYAQIPHPDFEGWPAGKRPAKRQAIIGPHLKYPGGTALEIGAYLGAFSHWLEDLKYNVTAVERNPKYCSIARQVRDLCGKNFEIVEGLFADLTKTDYDIVLALNVFHHSLKKKNLFQQLESFLPKLRCRMMFFEPHHVGEAQMAKAYCAMNAEQFVEFVANRTGLTKVEQIGAEGNRAIFKLER